METGMTSPGTLQATEPVEVKEVRWAKAHPGFFPIEGHMVIDQEKLKATLDEDCKLIRQALASRNIMTAEIVAMIAAYRDSILKRHGLREGSLALDRQGLE